MHHIGIIGAGIGGMHLGLFLLQHGVETTIYTQLGPDGLRSTRLPNTAALAGTALSHASQLGVSHWDTPDTRVHEFELGVSGMPELHFCTPTDLPLQFIDMRLYLPRLLEDFAARGGHVVTGAVDAAAVSDLSTSHELLVVASGRGGLSDVFPRVAERSPYTAPQRHLLAGLFRGIRFSEPFRFIYQIVPEHGEVFEFPILTARGPVNGLLIEAVPGGGFDSVVHMVYEEDPAAFDLAVVELLCEHLPQVRPRVDDPRAFGALGALDIVQGAIVPVVRRGVVELREGRFALALGDAHVTHDPVNGQGANSAAKAAWRLGELLVARISEGGPLDGEFCASVEDQLWRFLQPATEWSNASLQPPTPQAIDLIAAAASNPAIAQQFVKNFDDAERQWGLLRSPEAVASFIQAHSGPAS